MSGLRIGSVRGIPVRLHFSLLLALPFLAFAFGEAFRQAASVAGVPSELLSGTPLLWGLAVAVGLFAAVLVHELAHSLYALRAGGQVKDITLLVLGGVSRVSRMPKGARHEAAMAAAGPVSSLAIGAACLGASVAADGSFNLRFALFYSGALNLLIGAFNLLPAFPMDGGRILRAALLPLAGPLGATRIAALVGQALAVVLGLAAAASMNLVLVAIAVFVFVGARGEAREAGLRDQLARLSLAELMERAGDPVEPGANLDTAVERFYRSRTEHLPVVGEGGPAGILLAADLAKVAPGERSRTPVERLARPAVTAPLGENAGEAWERLAEAGGAAIVVVDEGRPVGVLTQESVSRGLRLAKLRSPEEQSGWLERRGAER